MGDSDHLKKSKMSQTKLIVVSHQNRRAINVGKKVKGNKKYMGIYE
jgi:hypothetical protein